MDGVKNISKNNLKKINKRLAKIKECTYLVVDDNVVLGSHVISNVVVNNKTQQPVEQCQIDLLVHLLIARLQHDVTLSLSRLPHVLQVVDAWAEKTQQLQIKSLHGYYSYP